MSGSWYERALRIENPAWDYISEIPDESWPMSGKAQFDPPLGQIPKTGANFVFHRSRVTGKWTWAIPAPLSLAWIAERLDGRPVVELGAGNGYWAWCLSQMGVDVVAYDIAPIGFEHSWFHPNEDDPDGWYGNPQEFYPVKQGGVEVLTEHPDRVLFLCWPNYDTSFAFDAISTYGGSEFIYIGEGSGGCNADWQFWAVVAGDGDPWGKPDGVTVPPRAWKRVDSGPLLQWSGLHDGLDQYRRMREA